MAGFDDDDDFFQESEPVEHSIEIAPKETNESVLSLNALILVSVIGLLVAWFIIRRSRHGSQQYTAPDSVGFPRNFLVAFRLI